MFPDRWAPLYEMVTFSHIPYADALEQGKQQDALLEKIGYDQVEAAIAEGKEKTENIIFTMPSK